MMTKTSSFIVKLKPIAAARARVTSRGFSYYPKAYSQFQRQCDKELKMVRGCKGWPRDALVEVTCEFVLPPFKTSLRKDPMGDVDNFGKAITDAMTKSELFWEDDRQMMILHLIKRFSLDEEEPHIKVTLKEIEDE